MLWSEDSPDLFAMMEKGRRYIFRCAARHSSWSMAPAFSWALLCMIIPLDLHPVAEIVKKSVLCAALTAAHHAHPCLSVCNACDSPMTLPTAFDLMVRPTGVTGCHKPWVPLCLLKSPQIPERLSSCCVHQIDKQMYQRVNEWISKWMEKKTNKQANEQMNEAVHNPMSDRMTYCMILCIQE